MLVKTKVLDKSGQPIFRGQTEINGRALILLAASREALVREKGAKWAADAIPVFGQELIKSMKSENLGDVMDNAAIMVAMAAWLYDSVYCGVTEVSFLASDLEFTMSHTGMVVYQRHPASAGTAGL